MRPLWRWIVHGKPKPIPVIEAEWTFEDPRTDALVAMAAALQEQTLVLERFAVAAESVAGALERAEQRALPSEEGVLTAGDAE